MLSRVRYGVMLEGLGLALMFGRFVFSIFEKPCLYKRIVRGTVLKLYHTVHTVDEPKKQEQLPYLLVVLESR